MKINISQQRLVLNIPDEEVPPWNLIAAQGVPNASMMGLPDGRKSFKTGLFVLIQYRL